jgi:hypothetical protein
MTWFRADDQQHSHPKVIEAGLEAMGLWLLAGTYCCDKLTDGFVAWPVIERLAGGKAKAKKLAKLLVDAKGESEVGLWEYVDGGCRFHDWNIYQLPAAEERARRAELSAKRSVAGTLGAQKRWQTDTKRDGKTALLPSESDGKPDGKADTKRDGKTALLPSESDGKPIAPSPDPDPELNPPQPPFAPEPETWELPGHDTEAWARGISDATERPCSAPDSPTARAAILRAVATHCPAVATPADRARWIRARAREYALAHPGVLLTAFNFEVHLNSPKRPRAPTPEVVTDRPYHRETKGYERPPASVSEAERTAARDLLAKVTSGLTANEKTAVSS